VAIAVNANSMATWFTAVFSQLDDVLFDIRIEDQDHSARLLRHGTVMGAVTTERASVPGCRVESLGGMRYVVPVASPGFVERYLHDGFIAEALSLAWNRGDALQEMLLDKAFRRAIPRPVHYVPTAEGFGAAVRAGAGWGMFPEQLTASALPTVLRWSRCPVGGSEAPTPAARSLRRAASQAPVKPSRRAQGRHRLGSLREGGSGSRARPWQLSVRVQAARR
jgi:DNA-binding transcriptional LysR family regulator